MDYKLGLRKGVRNPTAIANETYNDPSGSQKNLSGTSGALMEIVATSTTAFVIEDKGTIRAYNNTGVTQFIWIGEADSVPLVVDATNGFALAPLTAEVFFCSETSDDKLSIMGKTSSASVQVVKLQN